MQPIEKELIDKKLLAFMNGEGHTHARQIDSDDGTGT
jgi:hypothetical protein